MKKLFALLIFVSAIQLANAQTPFWNWAVTAGGTNSDRAGAITYTTDGNLLVTGFFSDTSSFGATILGTGASNGMFIAKYTTNGILLWAKKTGQGASGLEPRQIHEDASGNILISGYFGDPGNGGNVTFLPSTVFISHGGRDAFVAKFNSSGNLIWARQIGSTDDDVMVASDNNNGFILQGSAFSKIYAGNITGKDSIDFTGNWKIWLAQYTSAGALTGFSSFIKNPSFMNPAAIKADASGKIYISGMYYSHPVVGITPDTASLPNAGGALDVYLIKVDTINFHRMWQQRIHGAGNDDAKAMDFDSSENLIVTGSYTAEALFGTVTDSIHLYATTGGNEIFMTSYDTTGTLVWARNAGYGIGGAITPYSITHSDSLIYVVGRYTGQAVFGDGADTFQISWVKNFYVAAFTDSGSLHWARSSDGSFADGLNGVTVDDSGFVYTAGYYSLYCILDTSATDTIYLPSAGVDDIFVGRLGYKISIADTTGDTTINSIAAWKLQNSFKLYPNPSSKNLNLEWNENLKPVAVTVYDLSGNLIYSENNFSDERKMMFDVSKFSSGTYFISIKSNKGIAGGKFSVVRE